MTELIKQLVNKLINPVDKEKKRSDYKYDLEVKFTKSIYLKEYLKTRAWVDFQRPIIFNSIESGVGRLIRDGLELSETEIKAVIADMRANLNTIIEMRHAIETGEESGLKLEAMRKTDEAKNTKG